MTTHARKKLSAGAIVVAGRAFSSRKEAIAYCKRNPLLFPSIHERFGASLEEWLAGEWDHARPPAPLIHDGRIYPSQRALCEELGVSCKTVKGIKSRYRLLRFQTAVHILIARKKAKQGMGLQPREDALIKATKSRLAHLRTDPDFRRRKQYRPPIAAEFRGVRYNSIRELSAAFQISRETIRWIRDHENVSVPKALEIAIARRDRKEIRAFGTVYRSLKELAHHKHVDLSALRYILQKNSDNDIEAAIRMLRAKSGPSERKVRARPPDPVLFGWRFRSWKAAWEYWRPVGISLHRFYAHLEAGHDIDARCQHELEIQAERGNLTKDLRKADQLGWGPEDGGPAERVAGLPGGSLQKCLARFGLVDTPKQRGAQRKTRRAPRSQQPKP